ncbi:MAG TPA: YeeE/YedE family protein [Desulfobacteraceae bacterium]|nr:YeeE/YedE family protein [Desulfobacteraceae bacterium]
MMTSEPLLLASGSGLLGFAFGVVLYRGDYCMVAMLRDFFLIRNTTLLRSFVLYFLVASVLFHVGGLGSLLPFLPPPTFAPPSLATMAGGVLFGVGIVLAGGCVVGTLYKMAGGNLINWIAFAGILAGSLLYAEVHPLVQQFSSQTILIHSITAAQNNSVLKAVILLTVIAAGLLAIWKWSRHGGLNVTAFAKGYIQPWKTAIILALLNFFYYVLSGTPMGITTAYAKAAAYLEQVFLPGHVAGLAYFQENSVIFQAGETLITGGAGPRMDFISHTELALMVGIFSGALATALYYGEFRIYGLPPRRQATAALAGGILLAMGARIASGCNVKFFLGGLPLLAWQAIFFYCGYGRRSLDRHVHSDSLCYKMNYDNLVQKQQHWTSAMIMQTVSMLIRRRKKFLLGRQS